MAINVLSYEEVKRNVPDVSVIIPTHNRVEMLKEALGSVFHQDFNGTAEIFVVDDASCDGTKEVVKREYPKVQLIHLEQNSGHCTARNAALRKAQGQWIALLDDDDLWLPGYVSRQVAVLQENQRSFAVSDIVSWNTKRQVRKTVKQAADLRFYSSMLHHLLITNFILTPSSVLFSKGLFQEVGFFGDNLSMGGDAEFYIRCLLKGYRPVSSGSAQVIRRIHSCGQMTDVKNLARRKKYRLIRAEKFYPEIKKQCPIVPLKKIKAEIEASFLPRYLRKRELFHLTVSAVKCIYYGSPWQAFTLAKSYFKRTVVTKS